jgi:hypothetical protein
MMAKLAEDYKNILSLTPYHNLDLGLVHPVALVYNEK